MKIKQYIVEQNKPKLVALHYFNVYDGDLDPSSMAEYGLKKDRRGKLYLPQYNTSGAKFDRNFSALLRLSNNTPPRTIKLDK